MKFFKKIEIKVNSPIMDDKANQTKINYKNKIGIQQKIEIN